MKPWYIRWSCKLSFHFGAWTTDGHKHSGWMMWTRKCPECNKFDWRVE